MRSPLLHSAGCIIAVLFTPSCIASAAELRLRFVYDGDPPTARPIVADRDKEVCGKFKLTDERLIVNPENRGIQNVVVYLYTGRGGTKISEIPPRNQEIELTAENCRFHPHIVVAQAGDTLVFNPKSAVGHNLNVNFFKNKPMGMVIPVGAVQRFKLTFPEPAPIPLECNIHPWMEGYLVLLEHPYVGVSDADGHVLIHGLPSDTELMFRVFHEAGGGRFTNVKVNGAEATWKRNLFSVTTTDGVTDLGTVLLKPDVFAEREEKP